MALTQYIIVNLYQDFTCTGLRKMETHFDNNLKGHKMMRCIISTSLCDILAISYHWIDQMKMDMDIIVIAINIFLLV
uniref:Uncharacterized protein n=1 Tax=Tetranychus urticae TaxID=32264 RepID=T1KKJ5_TETUR